MTWHAGAACHPDRKPAHMTAQEWNRTWFPNPNAPVDGVAARDAAQDAGSCRTARAPWPGPVPWLPPVTTIGSLCSGIGGLELGIERALGARTVWQAEIDPHASKVLAHHWPGVPNIGDVRDLTAMTPVDILTAGYPCQPFSTAGRRKGTDDPRHLWPAVHAAIAHLGPSLVVLENVRGHLTLGFDRVLGDLADIGYDAEWRIVRASDVGCCHQRARLFVAAYPNGGAPGRNGGGIPHQAERGPWWGPSVIHSAQHGRGATAPDASHIGRQRDGRARDRGAGPATQAKHGPPRPDRDRPRDGRGVAAADTTSAERRATQPDALPAATHRPAEPRERRGPDAADADGTPWRQPGSAGEAVHEPRAQQRPGRRSEVAGRADFGPYAAAVRRQEQWHGPAPDPTTDGRLSPAFVQWMMGYPAGWVTDVLDSRNAALRCLGNAVVPQVAETFALGLMQQEAAA